MALPMTKEELIGTEFQKKVWNEIKKIPRGSTLTYKELAKKIDKPKKTETKDKKKEVQQEPKVASK